MGRAAALWAKALRQTPALGAIWNVVKAIADHVLGLEEWRAGLNSRADAVHARVDALEAGNTKSEEAVGPRDCGVWDGRTIYRKDDGVTVDGSYWIAQRETRSTPTERVGDWRLAVRRGKQGRDGKPADAAMIDDRLRHYGLIP